MHGLRVKILSLTTLEREKNDRFTKITALSKGPSYCKILIQIITVFISS